MIVYELINNAARHAFDDDAGGEIRVVVARVGGFVECRVSNDGTAPFTARHGQGLNIIADLASRLGGRLEQQFRDGGSASLVSFLV